MKKLMYLLTLVVLTSCGNDSAIKQERQKSTIISGNQAIDDVTRLIFEDKENHALYFKRAGLSMEKELYENAIYDLNKAIRMDSSIAQYYHLLSDAYMDNLDSRNALETMKRVTELYPERIPSLLKLSETELILKQYQNSIMTASKVLSLKPSEAEGYFMLGLNFRETDDLDKSMNSFQTAVEMNPDLVDAWLILGQMHETKKDPIALKYYEGAMTADPNNITAMHYAAMYLQTHQKEQEAIDLYKQIIVRDKFYSDAHLNTGILYLEMDSVALAKEHFIIMTKSAPQKYLGHFYLGLVNEIEGNFDIARENLRSAQNLNQEDKRIGQAIARVSEKQGS